MWVTEAEFREWRIAPPSTDVASSLIVKSLRTAIRQIVELCGDVVQEIQNATALTPRIEAFRDAQEKFAYAEILPYLASRLRSGGIVTAERDGSGETTNSYASMAAIAAEQTRMRVEARMAVEIYFIAAEVIEHEVPHSVNVPLRYVF